MNLLFLISLVVSFILCISDTHLDPTRIRVFPELNRSIAGVFQVSYVNNLNQVYYAFNASEARSLCLSLAVNMASKAQVQKALSRGLETCRFGWTDEHLAVIPRIRPLSNCGQNKSGLVEWRAAVNNKFDVFCFNESDNAAHLDDMTQRPSESTLSPSGSTLLHLSVSSTPSQSSFIPNVDSGAEKALIVGSDQGFTAKKTVLITSAVVISLVAVVAAVYIKLRRRQSGSDKQQHTETEEWNVKYKGTNKSCSAKVEDISV